MDKIINYEHHGKNVFVKEKLKGTHRECCLCFNGCKKFNPDNRDKNCKIANELFNICVKYNLTTPVFECPNFQN